MTRSIAHSLWLRQTAYTVVVVAIVVIAVSAYEVRLSFHNEHDRMQKFGSEIVGSFADAASRAAFHVDRRQAQSVVDGIMHYEELDNVTLESDLGIVLAERTRVATTSSFADLAEWLFSDVTLFSQELSVRRSDFVGGSETTGNDGEVIVGVLTVHANSMAAGQSFMDDIAARVIGLIVEFLLLATALAFIFYRSITKPLQSVAEQLGAIDSRSSELMNIATTEYHQQDELGLVVDRTNELLRRISEQQDDLVQREKVAALGSMLTEVAHELNNPLAVVIAQTELLAETARDRGIKERAQKILRPAKRCASIVRKFLSLARQRKIEKTVLDVRGLIVDAVDMLDYQFAKRDTSVEVSVDEGIARIRGDGSQLGQVLMNVLLNAHQAMSANKGKREIKVSATAGDSPDRVVITVTDNGPGVPADIRHKVFRPFFTTKPEGRGTGLGLSFCSSVVEGHGGSIDIRDAVPNGAAVLIELPATSDSELGDLSPAHRAQTLTSLHVLIVDDEAALAGSIAEVLEKYGHTTTTANNAADALKLLGRSTFDIILADVHMPVTDGMEFYRDVQRVNPDQAEKFVFITGDSLDPKLVEFFDEQSRPYLNKPFEIGELLRAVDRFVLTPRHGG